MDLVNNGEASRHGVDALRVSLPYLFDGVLGGDNDLLWSEPNDTVFDLGGERLEVRPDLEMGSPLSVKDGEVINDNNLFAVVTVPPLGDGLVVGIGVGTRGGSRLAATGVTIDPHAAHTREIGWLLLIVIGDTLKRGVESNTELSVDSVKFSWE